jgi:hypothetical protein
MKVRRRGLPLYVLVLGALCSAACASTASPTDPTPGPPIRQDFNYSGTVAPAGIASHGFTIKVVEGTLSAALSWGAGAVDLNFYLTDGTCTGYPPAACSILAQSTAVTGASEQVTRLVKSGEKYILWVDNLLGTAGASYTISATAK